MRKCHVLLAQTLTSKQKAMPIFRNSSHRHSWHHLPKSELVCKFTSALTQSQPFFKLLEAREKIIFFLYLKNNGLNFENAQRNLLLMYLFLIVQQFWFFFFLFSWPVRSIDILFLPLPPDLRMSHHLLPICQACPRAASICLVSTSLFQGIIFSDFHAFPTYYGINLQNSKWGTAPYFAQKSHSYTGDSS